MRGGVIWITGLSASGKSTLAYSVHEYLDGRGNKCILLDGDELRKIFSVDQVKNGYYEIVARRELALKYSRLCHLLASQGCVVVISTISMFKDVYFWNRENIENYFEIFLDADKNTLQKRDPKKIYDAYRKGEIKNVAGFDLLVDYPVSSDLVININGNTEKELVLNTVISNFKNIDWIEVVRYDDEIR